MKQQVSLYSSHNDKQGGIVAIGEVLTSRFADNISDIIELRKIDHTSTDYLQSKREIKSRLQCFSPSATLINRKDVDKLTGILQIDFDAKDCEGYDIDELKAAVFALPFICLVSLSCSGAGFYALALIAEPDKQKEYAAHIFKVLEQYGLSCDTSKGRNYNDLRYVSYDANMDWKVDVEPLRIKQFKPQISPKIHCQDNYAIKHRKGNNGGIIASQANQVLTAQIGGRWQVVQQAAYTLGGYGAGLEAIEQAIYSNPAFNGEEKKYLKCAADCYKAGQLKPFY